ncbi:MAG: glycine cleavage system protein GcvH [Anaerolineae bacterium]
MKFSQTHEWVAVSGDVGIVGITEHARRELGDIVYLQLPQIGAHIKAGDEVAILESTKAAADIYTPVSGEILAIHEDLVENLDLINKTPEKEGWLFKIKLLDLNELENLLEKHAYLKLIN